jgi:hypothetical protein
MILIPVFIIVIVLVIMVGIMTPSIFAVEDNVTIEGNLNPSNRSEELYVVKVSPSNEHRDFAFSIYDSGEIIFSKTSYIKSGGNRENFSVKFFPPLFQNDKTYTIEVKGSGLVGRQLITIANDPTSYEIKESTIVESETRAAETRAAETRAAETRAAETRAAETRAAETRAAETRAAENKIILYDKCVNKKFNSEESFDNYIECCSLEPTDTSMIDCRQELTFAKQNYLKEIELQDNPMAQVLQETNEVIDSGNNKMTKILQDETSQSFVDIVPHLLIVMAGLGIITYIKKRSKKVIDNTLNYVSD